MALTNTEKSIVLQAIDLLVREAHGTAQAKGWWDKPRGFGDQVALMHSELSEALEEYRRDANPALTHYSGAAGDKPEGVASEFADVLIRMADTSGHYQIPLGQVLLEKLTYNASRPYRHGGKAI